MRTRALTVALLLLGWTGSASAHAWGNAYTLPIPFELYAYGAAAALILSFVLIGFFATADATRSGAPAPSMSLDAPAAPASYSSNLRVFRIASVMGLLLTILAGLFGNPSPFANFSMTFFWVVFVLGFTYVTALIGDIYALISPWRVLCDWAEERWRAGWVRHRPWPGGAGYWPAFAFYGVFLWIELFGHGGPRMLAGALLGYTAITLLGAAVYGKQSWLQYGEFFSVFLRLIAMMAPFVRVLEGDTMRVRLRLPLSALIDTPVRHRSLAIFILFMLSSTAFDGAHETLPWVNVFWLHVFPHLMPFLVQLGMRPYVVAPDLYYAWQEVTLALSPFVYFAFYCLCMWLTKQLTGAAATLSQLICHFALSLVPIAFVYHVAHYFGLLLTDGPNIVALISDPFGYGWNLLGTARLNWTIIPPAGVVWHTQVWLILTGHIAGVYVAHMQALRLFPGRALAMRSQLPILLLMVCLTGLGLWILSLPIAAGQVNSSFTMG